MSITLSKIESFFVGGKAHTVTGHGVKTVRYAPHGPERQISIDGDYETGQMYVQHFALAAPISEDPLLLWHGGGMSGVAWESTPDGRPGWLS